MPSDSNDSKITKRNVLGAIGSESDSVERRGFLRGAFGVVGGFLSVLGLSTAAEADATQREAAKVAAREFSSKAVVAEAVEEHATGVLAELAERGYSNRPAVTALPLEERHESVESYVESNEGTFVGANIIDGEPTVSIRIKQQVSTDLELVLTVEPHTEKSRAVLYRPSDRSTVLVARSSSDDEVTTQEDCSYCTIETFCTLTCGPYSCGYEEVEMRHSCQDAGCSYCKTIGYDCYDDEYNCSL